MERLQLAERFQALLDGGEARSGTSLARQYTIHPCRRAQPRNHARAHARSSIPAGSTRQYGLTKPRVTQIMELLQLDPLILGYVRQLAPGTPERLITERKLRRLVKLPPAQQLVVAEKGVTGFLAWRTQQQAA